MHESFSVKEKSLDAYESFTKLMPIKDKKFNLGGYLWYCYKFAV